MTFKKNNNNKEKKVSLRTATRSVAVKNNSYPLYLQQINIRFREELFSRFRTTRRNVTHALHAYTNDLADLNRRYWRRDKIPKRVRLGGFTFNGKKASFRPNSFIQEDSLTI